MKHPKEAAAEAEAERCRAVLLIHEGSIIELEAFYSFLQLLIVIAVDRIDGGEDNGLDLLETCHRLVSRIAAERDRIANPYIRDRFDTSDEITDITCGKHRTRNQLELEYACILGLILSTGMHEPDLISRMQGSGEEAAMHDYPAVWIIMGIEYERFERIVGIALRRRYHVDNGFIERIDTFTRLRGDKARGIRIQSEIMVYLVQA